MFWTFTCPSSGVLMYRLFHCCMWCYALGVVPVVLRSWCVVLCTVCQLVSSWILTDKQCARLHANSAGPQPQHLGHNTTCGSETTYTWSVRKVSDRIFLCEHLMDYNLARLHEPTLNLSVHA